MPNIPGLSSIEWGGALSGVMYWLGYILLVALILGVIIGIYFFMGYKYKVTILKQGGTGQKSSETETTGHFITKIRKDRAKIVKNKRTGITKWKLLLGMKTIPPVTFDNIYPGNNIYLYQTSNNAFHPFKISVSNPDASFEAIPSDISFWMGLESQQKANDYSKQSFWSQYGNVAVMMGTVMFCLILVGVTVYYTYNHANGVTGALNGLTSSLKNVNVIPGLG